ncbi:carboxypeptidase regulatory-like domain-containing protein [Deinococcus roseus]|uniref:Carboxypeptidase regulatory-like domain-containing protein n=1 Tax=Deinococcus roseus TaxID=392414 RepID=A0ABQ2D400_9DEIO|nr:carboxypeptidase regulatory-like domain-containing protein [Deinococcus roseus]GGJ45388.1 hypothetical protein GCM10008938_34620 [Deinococcus roseus]
MLTRNAIPMLCVALLVGCKGGEGTPLPSAPGFNLQLKDSVITLMQGDSKDILVTIQPENGFAADVNFTLVQPSADKLTASFAPSSSKTQTKLTIKAPMELPVNTYSLFIKGTSGSLKKTFELKVNVTKSPLITVGGKIKNLIGGNIQGATVRIRGFNNTESTDTSDASGKFMIKGVLAPYTATVQLSDGETHTFQTLNLPNPTLNLFSSKGIISATDVTVAGTLSGGAGVPNPINTVSQVVYASITENLGIKGFSPGQGGPYTIKLTQLNEKVAEGQVFALQWQANLSGATSIPVTYTGFGTSSKFISGGASATGKDISLDPVSQSVLSGNVNLPLPAGLTLVWKSLGAALVPRGGFVLAADYSNSTSFTYAIPTPDILKNRYVLAVGAVSDRGSGLILNRAGLSAAQTQPFTLKAPPFLTAPADTATNAGNVLSWNKGTFTSPFFVVRYQDLLGATRYVYTTSTSYAAPLEKNMQYTWNLIALDGFANADAFVQEDALPFGYPNAGSMLDFDFGASKEQTFTTAP